VGLEPLDPEAEHFALEQRKTAISQHVERLVLAPDADLYKIEAWRNGVGALASDTQLVHTVYYRHPRAIDQIARHFGRTDDELLAAMEARKARLLALKS
jgi:hypothetical protein